jgi:hypothetical protein
MVYRIANKLRDCCGSDMDMESNAYVEALSGNVKKEKSKGNN